MAICMAAIFKVPRGSEPKKLINKPVTNMRSSLDMNSIGSLKISFS
jgi:hypothetical protein